MFIPDYVDAKTVRCVHFSQTITFGSGTAYFGPDNIIDPGYFCLLSVQACYYGNVNGYVTRSDMVYELRFAWGPNFPGFFYPAKNGSTASTTQTSMWHGKADHTQYFLNIPCTGWALWCPMQSTMQPTIALSAGDASASLLGSYIYAMLKPDALQDLKRQHRHAIHFASKRVRGISGKHRGRRK